MFSAAFTNQFIISCLIGLLVWAAVSDFRTFTIPNRVSLGMLILYPAYVLAAPTAIPWLFALAMGVVVFFIGCALFAMKAMGGGDVKLLAVTAIWAGPQHFLEFFAVMGVAGLLLAIFVAARTALADARAGEPRTFIGTIADFRHVPILKLTVPYGVAVSTAGFYVALRLLGP